MRLRRAVALLTVLAATAGCEKKTPPPTPSPGGGTETIRGTERLGWDQRAADTVELAAFRYAIYVDGARSEAADVACANTAGANGFGCSSRLPSMTPGIHTIELAAFILDGSAVLESARSSPLRITVTSSVAGASSSARLVHGVETTSDGQAIRLVPLAEGLEDVVDIGIAPDGRVFVAQQDGLVRILDRAGREQQQSRPAGRIVALAIDPEFAANHFVYVAEAPRLDGERASARQLTVARYREVNGVLGERMVLLHGTAARPDDPAAALGFGPEGKLYIALDDGGSAVNASDPASLNGKLLRVNRDGTTPDDQAGGVVQASGLRSPRGVDWDASGGAWLADGMPRRPERFIAMVIASKRPYRLERKTSYELPEGSDPADAVVYTGELLPRLRGNLLIATRDGVLRVRFDPRSPTRVTTTEMILERVGRIRALAVGADGTLYIATTGAIGRVTPNL